MDQLNLQKHFPELNQKIRGKNLVYLDSAATAFKPRAVIDEVTKYLSDEVANIHRGAHYLADRGTERFEASRSKIAKFINAKSNKEIIFVRSTTEGINLVASSLGGLLIGQGDEVLLSHLEHHGNLIPWHMITQQKQAKLVPFQIQPDGRFDLQDLKTKLNSRVKILAISGCSNVLGGFTQLKEAIQLAHSVGVKVVVDAAQLVTCQSIDVQDLDCDFLAFSGHKLFGPTGIGVLYGKEDLLNSMPPYQGGGSMIQKVSFSEVSYLNSPHRFEAGTPAVAEAIGLGAAIDFVEQIGLSAIHHHEQQLVNQCVAQLKAISGVTVFGHSDNKAGIVSLKVDGIHHSDIANILDQQGIAVRAGHMCAQPVMDYLKVNGVLRASFSIYNTSNDVDAFIHGLKKAKELLS